MDIHQFETELRNSLSQLNYVESISIFQVGTMSIKGKVYLKKNYILELRFTEFDRKYEFTLSFTLIFNENRIWGLDRDNRIGGHIHPLGNTKLHEMIEPKSVSEIVSIFDSICTKLIGNDV